MKKSLLIKLHLYTGIFTSFYLLAFGVSSLVLNHNINVERNEVTRSWQSDVSVDPSLPDLQLAESIRDEIGIMGWLPRWEFKRDSTFFKFSIVHPGRKYYLTYEGSKGHVGIKEIPKGFMAVFHGLHFLNGNIPNAPFLIRSWIVYQWMALFAMLVSLILGIWLWLKNNYKTWQGIAFGSLFIGTIIIMILL
jgi:hypothetical protein